MKIDKQAYERLIEQGQEFLNKYCPDSPEKDRIKTVLEDSVRFYFPTESVRKTLNNRLSPKEMEEWLNLLMEYHCVVDNESEPVIYDKEWNPISYKEYIGRDVKINTLNGILLLKKKKDEEEGKRSVQNEIRSTISKFLGIAIKNEEE